MNCKLIFSTFCLLILFAQQAEGEGPTLTHRENDISPIIVSSSQVKNYATQQGLESELTKNSVKKAELLNLQSKSIYDTLLRASSTYIQDKNQKTTPIFGTDNKSTLAKIELNQKTPFGTSLSVGFINDREKTNSPFATLPDYFDNQVYTTIRQPLLKNFLGTVDRNNIQSTHKQAESLSLAAQARLQSYVFECLVAYWQLYLSERNLLLEEDAFKQAKKLYDANFKKNDMGLIEAADLSNFGSNKDIRQSLFLDAQSSKIKAQEHLSALLNIYPQSLKTLSKEVFTSKELTSVDTLIHDALTLRPDYQSAKKEVEVAAIGLKMAKNKLWPELDLLGSLNLNGVDSQYNNSTDNILDNHPKWQIGMEFNLPLQNRDARSQVKLGELDKKNKIVTLKQKENEIISQIRTSFQNYKIQQQRIKILNSAIVQAKNRTTQEWERFNQGRSDSDAVIRSQLDYIEAQKMLLQAQVGFKFAETDLLYAQGKLLE